MLILNTSGHLEHFLTAVILNWSLKMDKAVLAMDKENPNGTFFPNTGQFVQMLPFASPCLIAGLPLIYKEALVIIKDCFVYFAPKLFH